MAASARDQDLVLDVSAYQLLRGGRRVTLQKTPMELLALLVERQGALVTREDIVERIWGDGIHVDVDAGINTAIRKIRAALADDSVSPRFLETVVGKGYRFVGPITVVGATPDREMGTALSSAASHTPRGRAARRPAIVSVIVVVAVLALALAAQVWRRGHSKATDPAAPVTVAVVPFANLAEEPGQDYLADGITEEILTQLGQLDPDALRVVRLRWSTEGSRDLATVGVDHSSAAYVLEGSVRRAGDEARIAVRLIRLADNATVWTESFDRALGDVLVLESEIAQRVGSQLRVALVGRVSPRAVKPDVIDAYLHGRFEMSHYPVPEVARGYFERSIALDRTYAPALAGLADFYRSRAIANDVGAEDAWRSAEQYAERALGLDPNAAEPHVAIAQIRLMHDWDWAAAREQARRAVQLNPSSPEAHAVLARYDQVAGRLADAVAERKQAVALDPLRADVHVQLGIEQWFARRYDDAAASARQAIAIDSTNAPARGLLCVSLGRMQRFEEALSECRDALVADGHRDWVTAYEREYKRHGYDAAAQLIAKKDLDDVLHRQRPDLWDVANAYVLAGMRDQAFDVLFRGVKVHEPGLLQIRVDPDFDPIRDDVRYAKLIRQIGFPTE